MAAICGLDIQMPTTECINSDLITMGNEAQPKLPYIIDE